MNEMTIEKEVFALNIELLSKKCVTSLEYHFKSIKKHNPLFLKKRIVDISTEEWKRYQNFLDAIGEGQMRGFLLEYYPNHFEEIRDMKHFDLAYIILANKVEQGKKIEPWGIFIKSIKKKETL